MPATTSFFIDTGTQTSPHMRTSLVVDPPNGRVPANTTGALWRMAENRETWSRSPRTPADRPPATRCLIGFNAGPPMVSSAYNNMMKLVQGPGYVAILNEMVNDHRIIPTGGGEAAPAHMRFWQGDSVGRWEGDKLVVETTNFRPETNFRGSGENMHLTERFSRVDADTLRYEYTVNDPESFEAPFSVIHDMRRTDDDVYEYACHEGNVAMHLMLSGGPRTGTREPGRRGRHVAADLVQGAAEERGPARGRAGRGRFRRRQRRRIAESVGAFSIPRRESQAVRGPLLSLPPRGGVEKRRPRLSRRGAGRPPRSVLTLSPHPKRPAVIIAPSAT